MEDRHDCLSSTPTLLHWRDRSVSTGLAVAIPCYAGYNYLVSRVNAIVLDMEKAAGEIVNIVCDSASARAASPGFVPGYCSSSR